LQEASCNKPLQSRPPHCAERLLPEAGAWLDDPPAVALKFQARGSRSRTPTPNPNPNPNS